MRCCLLAFVTSIVCHLCRPACTKLSTRPLNRKHITLPLRRNLRRPKSIRSPMQRQLPLLILLHALRIHRIVEHLARFLQSHWSALTSPTPQPVARKSKQNKKQKKKKITNLQLPPLQNSNLPQRPPAAPHPLPRQRHLPAPHVLPERHAEQRLLAAGDDVVQRRARHLVLEDAPPLLVAEARAGVREGERVGLEFRFPGGGGRRGAGRVVGFDVPD